MKRLQRKCIAASALLHGLLVLLVFVGSAFVSRKPPVLAPSFELIEIPAHLVDDPNVWGGGNPNAASAPPAVEPAPAPAAPAPEPKEATKVPEPEKESVKEPVKEVKPAEPEPKPEPKEKQPDPENFDISKAVKKTAAAPKPEKQPMKFDFGKVQKVSPKRGKEAREDSDGAENSRGDRDTRVASARSGAISDALRRVQGGLSSVGGDYGVPGPGGNSLSYIFALQKRYHDAWVGAETAGGKGVHVEVEIARDGTILSARITRKSGNAEYDAAAQRTIDRVKKVDPLPEGTKESKRTYRFEITPNELN